MTNYTPRHGLYRLFLYGTYGTLCVLIWANMQPLWAQDEPINSDQELLKPQLLANQEFDIFAKFPGHTSKFLSQKLKQERANGKAVSFPQFSSKLGDELYLGLSLVPYPEAKNWRVNPRSQLLLMKQSLIDINKATLDDEQLHWSQGFPAISLRFHTLKSQDRNSRFLAVNIVLYPDGFLISQVIAARAKLLSDASAVEFMSSVQRKKQSPAKSFIFEGPRFTLHYPIGTFIHTSQDVATFQAADKSWGLAIHYEPKSKDQTSSSMLERIARALSERIEELGPLVVTQGPHLYSPTNESAPQRARFTYLLPNDIKKERHFELADLGGGSMMMSAYTPILSGPKEEKAAKAKNALVRQQFQALLNSLKMTQSGLKGSKNGPDSRKSK